MNIPSVSIEGHHGAEESSFTAFFSKQSSQNQRLIVGLSRELEARKSWNTIYWGQFIEGDTPIFLLFQKS